MPHPIAVRFDVAFLPRDVDPIPYLAGDFDPRQPVTEMSHSSSVWEAKPKFSSPVDVAILTWIRTIDPGQPFVERHCDSEGGRDAPPTFVVAVSKKPLLWGEGLSQAL